MKITQFRQGDVLLEKIKVIPVTAMLASDGHSNIEPFTQKGKVILALGEATGHHHVIHRGATLFMDTGSGSGGNYIKVTEPTSLVHEEHNPIDLKPGFYQVFRQREYFPKEIRPVQD